MATVKIYEDQPVLTTRIEKDFSINTLITSPRKNVVVNSTLPFRIRLTAIRIESLDGIVPPIPLQIIGFSNYII
jgi:hypothetical protein